VTTASPADFLLEFNGSIGTTEDLDVYLLRLPLAELTLGAPVRRPARPLYSGKRLSDLGGQDEALRQLKAHLRMYLQHSALLLPGQEPSPHGRLGLLYGNAGSGKSTLAGALAAYARQHLQTHVTHLSGTELSALRPATIAARLRAAMNLARRCQPALVVLDDLDLLTPLPQQDDPGSAVRGNMIADELRRLLLSETVLQARVLLLATCKDPASLHMALRSIACVGFSVQLLPPNAAARVSMLQKLALWQGMQSLQGDLEEVGLACEGYQASDLDQLLQRARQQRASKEHTRAAAVKTVYAFGWPSLPFAISLTWVLVGRRKTFLLRRMASRHWL
jgi:SpoVK/Ycf46/Vps4 family AAA+-type ATPase